MGNTPASNDEGRYYVGLDLGQAADFSCLAAVQQLPGRTRDDPVRYVMRGLHRWPLSTLYTKIVADVVKLMAKPPLEWCTLAVDKTGCGTPVVDMLRDAKPTAAIKPVLITAGFKSGNVDGDYHVPKRELVAVLQLVLQSNRLEIPPTIRGRNVLREELLAFRAKVTAKGNEVFEADWRQRAHDDAVLAVSMALFFGERDAGQDDDDFVPISGGEKCSLNAPSPMHLANRFMKGMMS
jgi:hypothetical protein